MESIRNTDLQNRKNFRVKVFLSNLVDKDVISMLQPINLMQSLVLNPKYFIRNNFIHPNDGVNKFIILSATILFSFFYIYRFFEILLDENMRRYREMDFLYFASYIDLILYCMGCVINLVINTIQTKQNVLFALTLQEVHRFLKNNPRLKCIIAKSWTYVSLLFLFHTVFDIIYLVFLRIQWHVIFNYLIVTSVDSNIVYGIVLIKLLTEKVELWNTRLLIKNYNQNTTRCKRMFTAYSQILDCYDLYKKCFQLPFLYQALQMFFQSLFNIQILIELVKRRFKLSGTEEAPPVSGSVYIWIMKSLVLQLSLSWHFDAFYVAVKNTQDACSFILTTSVTDEEYKLCKNIKRVTRTSFQRMSVFGLFYVDINLPFCLMALLTNYTIVLLQFAFSHL